MIEKIIYVADDGKEFDNEPDCLAHERDCNFIPLLDTNAVIMWDRHKERTTEIHDAFYVFVRNLPAARVLKDIFDEDGYECPCYNSYTGRLCTGNFYYDVDYDQWKNLEDLRIEYENLCEIFAS